MEVPSARRFWAVLLVTLLVCSTRAPAAAQVQSVLVGAPPDDAMPPWYSGTDCGVGPQAIASTTIGITHAKVTLNGEVVREVFYDAPGAKIVRLPVTFDSTHFADSTMLEVKMEAWDSGGGYMADSKSVRVYNKAFVYGNVTQYLGGMGTLVKGDDAAQTMAAAFSAANHTAQPSGTPADVRQTSDLILGQIPPSTAFAFYSHGTPGTVGDSATNLPGGVLLSTAQISNAVANKTSSQPHYNFVFADACSVGADPSVAYAFGVAVYGPPGPANADEAFLGWTVEMADNASLVDWTNRFFNYLLAGQQLQDAASAASDPNLGNSAPTDINGNDAVPQIWGDSLFKLHGVYGAPNSAAWFQ